MEYGGGGPISAEVSGIEDGDAAIEAGGTVYGDTLTCRTRYALPSELIVIYFHDDEVCWCLDTSESRDGECPVIAYDVFGRRKDREIASNFDSFFRQHLSLYSS